MINPVYGSGEQPARKLWRSQKNDASSFESSKRSSGARHLTQNYGPNGTFLGEGRDFRYPMSFTDETGEKIKPKPPYSNLPIDVQMTGRYVMGRTSCILHIMRALEKAVQYLEKNHGLKI
jgi:hypothetical protein